MKNLIPFLLIVIVFAMACTGSKEVPISKYYNYDNKAPLHDSLIFEEQNENYTLRKYNYVSRLGKEIYALLSIPKSTKPVPVIIFLHGVGDSKTRDYMEYGHKLFIENGYAVFRIDVYNHGERIDEKVDFSFTNDSKYQSRDIIIQTVFDLRRGIDLLEKIDNIDASRIGFYGISLGGVIGTVFAAVDERVKAPVIAIAGGGLNIMYETEALTDKALDYFSMIDPINFVEMISPRPLLMINASNDDVIPPITSKLLFKTAKEPKEIIWYDCKHHDIPQDKVFIDGVRWYDEHL